MSRVMDRRVGLADAVVRSASVLAPVGSPPGLTARLTLLVNKCDHYL